MSQNSALSIGHYRYIIFTILEQVETMLVSTERWRNAIEFLTAGTIGPHLLVRDTRLLAIHLEARPLTFSEAQRVLIRIGWHT